ncbi:MAG: PxxKW family cysteine-rich protein [Desulfohalobiaceae bacterium]|nr:PxxKW family cysteine-rich protein [Desulfohalobiaceae bacterium]
MATAELFRNAEITENGVLFNGFVLEPVVESCHGCDRVAEIENEWYCSSYSKPASKWRRGNCNFATHLKSAQGKGKGKVNPIKASKRAAGKK